MQTQIHRTNQQELKQRYQEHTHYIRNNNPQSVFASHILDNKHECGTIEEIMELIKPIKNTRLLIPFEQFYIQKHHQENKLITEQHPGEHNPLIQLAIDTTKTSHEQNNEPLVQENHHGTSTVKPPRQTSPQAHADEQHKHCM